MVDMVVKIHVQREKSRFARITLQAKPLMNFAQYIFKGRNVGHSGAPD